MAKKTVSILVYELLTLPYLAASWLLQVFGCTSYVRDVENCVAAVEAEKGCIIPELIKDYVVAAEDHRFFLHSGVDFYAIGRAIFRFSSGMVEGASTIEQQFVRTVTGRTERTFKRKVWEQILAASINQRCNKRAVLHTYCCIAYFGFLDSAKTNEKAHSSSSVVRHIFCAGIASRLKYPEPEIRTKIWLKRYAARIKYLLRKYDELDHKQHAKNLACVDSSKKI